MGRLFRSTIARLVASIFLVQILSSASAIDLLRARMLQVVYDDRARQVLDLRDDLLAQYYAGGRRRLTAFIEQKRGDIADPLIFVALNGGGRPLYSHIGAMPRLAAATRLQLVPVTRGAPPAEGLAIASILSDGSRLVVGVSTATERGFNLAFAEAIGLTVALTTVLALLGSLLVGYTISRRTHAIAETAEALAAGDFAARLPKEHSGDGFDHLRGQMNLMAERIDALVHELQSISAALAHDLRSPVARLRASLDTALREIVVGPAADALLLAKADAEALEQMLLAALELSRVQSGAVRSPQAPGLG
jgi:signal transduction histidine kinase